MPTIILTLVGVGLLATLGFLALGARRDTRRLDRLWVSLREASPGAVFNPAATADLPEPARRYLLRAIQPGAPPAASVELTIRGRLRLGPDRDWMDFSSREILHRTGGFIWRAAVSKPPIQGFDRYVRGAGEMRWRVAGLLPVMTAADPNVTRSARERYAAERVLLPSSMAPGPGVQWLPSVDGRARAVVTVDGEPIELAYTLSPVGDLIEIRLDRWGDQGGDEWRLQPYGIVCGESRSFGGYRIPTRLEVRWRPGAPDELLYFEGRITDAVYR